MSRYQQNSAPQKACYPGFVRRLDRVICFTGMTASVKGASDQEKPDARKRGSRRAEDASRFTSEIEDFSNQISALQGQVPEPKRTRVQVEVELEAKQG